MQENHDITIKEIETVDEHSADLLHKFRDRLARSGSGHLFVNKSKLVQSLIREKFCDRQRQFVAVNRNDVWTSHVVARISPSLRDANGSPLGMLGFFDSTDSSNPAIQVLQQATAWLRQQGCASVVGPIDGDTWHSYRINVGPFDEPMFLSEPVNPATYRKLWTHAGFEVAAGFHSKVVDNIAAILPVMETSWLRAEEDGYCFRTIDKQRFEQELEILYDLSIRSFRNNLLYEDISLDDFVALYADARDLIDQDLVWIASDREGNDVGFLFCIIDYAIAVNSMRGKSHLLAKLRFALNRKQANAVNFKSICVLPSHRRSSVAAGLMYKGYLASVAKGFQRANLCLIRDGNPSTKLDGGQSRIVRRYELYQAPNSCLKVDDP